MPRPGPQTLLRSSDEPHASSSSSTSLRLVEATDPSWVSLTRDSIAEFRRSLHSIDSELNKMSEDLRTISDARLEVSNRPRPNYDTMDFESLRDQTRSEVQTLLREVASHPLFSSTRQTAAAAPSSSSSSPSRIPQLLRRARQAAARRPGCGSVPQQVTTSSSLSELARVNSHSDVESVQVRARRASMKPEDARIKSKSSDCIVVHDTELAICDVDVADVHNGHHAVKTAAPDGSDSRHRPSMFNASFSSQRNTGSISQTDLEESHPTVEHSEGPKARPDTAHKGGDAVSTAELTPAPPIDEVGRRTYNRRMSRSATYIRGISASNTVHIESTRRFNSIGDVYVPTYKNEISTPKDADNINDGVVRLTGPRDRAMRASVPLRSDESSRFLNPESVVDDEGDATYIVEAFNDTVSDAGHGGDLDGTVDGVHHNHRRSIAKHVRMDPTTQRRVSSHVLQRAHSAPDTVARTTHPRTTTGARRFKSTVGLRRHEAVSIRNGVATDRVIAVKEQNIASFHDVLRDGIQTVSSRSMLREPPVDNRPAPTASVAEPVPCKTDGEYVSYKTVSAHGSSRSASVIHANQNTPVPERSVASSRGDADSPGRRDPPPTSKFLNCDFESVTESHSVNRIPSVVYLDESVDARESVRIEEEPMPLKDLKGGGRLSAGRIRVLQDLIFGEAVDDAGSSEVKMTTGHLPPLSVVDVNDQYELTKAAKRPGLQEIMWTSKLLAKVGISVSALDDEITRFDSRPATAAATSNRSVEDNAISPVAPPAEETATDGANSEAVSRISPSRDSTSPELLRHGGTSVTHRLRRDSTTGSLPELEASFQMENHTRAQTPQNHRLDEEILGWKSRPTSAHTRRPVIPTTVDLHRALGSNRSMRQPIPSAMTMTLSSSTVQSRPESFWGSPLRPSTAATTTRRQSASSSSRRLESAGSVRTIELDRQAALPSSFRVWATAMEKPRGRPTSGKTFVSDRTAVRWDEGVDWFDDDEDASYLVHEEKVEPVEKQSQTTAVPVAIPYNGRTMQLKMHTVGLQSCHPAPAPMNKEAKTLHATSFGCSDNMDNQIELVPAESNVSLNASKMWTDIATSNGPGVEGFLRHGVHHDYLNEECFRTPADCKNPRDATLSKLLYVNFQGVDELVRSLHLNEDVEIRAEQPTEAPPKKEFLHRKSKSMKLVKKKKVTKTPKPETDKPESKVAQNKKTLINTKDQNLKPGTLRKAASKLGIDVESVEPLEEQPDVPDSDSDISTEGSFDLSPDPVILETPTQVAPDAAATAEGTLMVLDPAPESSKEEVIPRQVVIGTLFIVYVEKMIVRIQRFARLYLAKKRWSYMKDVVIYSQRLYRAHLVRLQYIKMMTIKKAGRNITIAMKQFTKVDEAAEIPGNGVPEEDADAVGSADTVAATTTRRTSFAVDLADSLDDIKDSLNPLREGLRRLIARRLESASRPVPEINLDREIMWKRFWKLSTSVSSRYKSLYDSVLSEPGLIPRIRSVYLEFLGSEYDSDSSENGSDDDAVETRLNISDDSPAAPGGIIGSELSTTDRKADTAVSKARLRGYERKMIKLDQRITARNERVKCRLVDLRRRIAPEFILKLLEKTKVQRVSSAQYLRSK